MLGSVDNNVENLKFIGRRDMNMDANLKKVYDKTDEFYYHPYYNDAKELFRI